MGVSGDTESYVQVTGRAKRGGLPALASCYAIPTRRKMFIKIWLHTLLIRPNAVVIKLFSYKNSA